MTKSPEANMLSPWPAVKAQRYADKRGVLNVVDSNDGQIPFEIKRLFWVRDIPEGAERGGHAHLTCDELIFALSGSFDLYLDNGKEQATIHMTSPEEGIVVKAGVWCALRNFAPGTVCLVAASQPYIAEGYIHDYEKFRQWSNQE